MRSCVPANGRGWDANVEVPHYITSFAYTRGMWENPPLVHDLDMEPSVGYPASLLHNFRRTRLQMQVRPETYTQTHPSDQGSNSSGYIRTGPNIIILKDGWPADWHLGWALDGAEGLAVKIFEGLVEGVKDWAKPYVHDKATLVAFLRDAYLVEPDKYTHGLHRTKLRRSDLPGAIFESLGKFNALLGPDLAKALS